MQNTGTKDLLKLFASIYPTYMNGSPCIINWGRDGAVIKKIKEAYEDKTADMIRQYFAYWKSGYNNWVSSKAPSLTIMLGNIGDLQMWMNKQEKEEVLR